MSRLTINKKDNDYDYVANELELVRKLGKYEDIDEEPKRLEKIKIAFEIIKEKKVDCYFLSKCENVKKYNDGCLRLYPKLTRKEFKLLKEVLK